jgi:hypothetical protein
MPRLAQCDLDAAAVRGPTSIQQDRRNLFLQGQQISKSELNWAHADAETSNSPEWSAVGVATAAKPTKKGGASTTRACWRGRRAAGSGRGALPPRLARVLLASDLVLKPPASDLASSYHSSAGPERQGAHVRSFLPNQSLLAVF